MSRVGIPLKYRTPHYSGKLWRGFNLYLSKYVHPDLFSTICIQLSVDVDLLTRDENWASEELFEDFMKLLHEAHKDPEICKKVGRFSISPEALSRVEFTFNSAFPLPELFFLSLPRLQKRYALKYTVKLLRAKPGYFKYRFDSNDAKPQSEDVCLNALGMYEAADKMLPIDDLKVVHTQCRHQGGEACDFEISFSSKKLWKKRLSYLTGNLTLIFGLSFLLSHQFGRMQHFSLFSSMLGLTLSSLGVWLFSKYLMIHRYIAQYHDQMTHRVAELFEEKKKAEERLNETTLTKSLLELLSSTNDPSHVIRLCLRELERVFGYSRTLVMLLNSDRTKLYVADVAGFEKDTEKVFQVSLKYPSEGSNSRFFAKILENGTTEAIFDIPGYSAEIKPHLSALILEINIRSLIVAPIQDSEEKYGLIVVTSTKEGRVVTEVDKERIDAISKALSVAFKKARMFEKEKVSREVLEEMCPTVTKLAYQKFKDIEGNFRPKWVNASLFSVDMRGYSSLLDKIEPERATELTNIYLNYIHERIIRTGGIIDRQNGDQVVAFWCESQGNSLHAQNAMNSCKAILSEIDQLDQALKERGFEPVSFGGAIHTSRVLISLIGSEYKKDFGPVGDPMSVLARIESLSKEARYATETSHRGLFLFTDQTLKSSGQNIDALPWGIKELRGKEEKVNLFLIDPEICSSRAE